MIPTGTHIAYYHLCHRKLWLFAHGIRMEQNSELVAEGKLIDENSYPQRAERWQQIEFDGIKIDYYDAKKGIIREVKKSNKREYAHIAQLKFYMYILDAHHINVHHGMLEYPRLREREEVYLDEADRAEIPKWIGEIEQIIEQEHCPGLVEKTLCKRCAYFDFCYSNE